MRKSTDKTRTYLQLLIVLGAIILVEPLIETKTTSALENFIASAFFLALVLSALKIVSSKAIKPKNRTVLWLVRTVAVVSFLIDLAGAIVYGKTEMGYNILLGISTLGYAVLILLLCIFIIKDIFSGLKVSLDKIFGSVAVYLLLGLMWSCIYVFINCVLPDSIISSSGKALSSFSEFLYFSYTTLCTLGYGDIVARKRLGMTMANLEAIAGQLYLAILVARLVGLHIVHAREHPFPPGAEKTAGKSQSKENDEK
jgi:hypothetical protein